MRILLDTHVFLWYIVTDAKLPATFRVAIQDPDNEVFLSVASIWEAIIKYEDPPPSIAPRDSSNFNFAHGKFLLFRQGRSLLTMKKPASNAENAQ